MASQTIEISETVAVYPVVWNYRLGSWKLGVMPFSHEANMEVVKVSGSSSIKPEFLNEHAKLTAATVAAVRINKNLIIKDLHKLIEDGTAKIRYTVSSFMGVNEINSIELLREDDTVLTACGVFVPIPEGDQVVIRHILPHKEGVLNG